MYISYDSVACAAKFRFIRWCPIYATTTSTTSFTLTLSGICIQNKRTKEEAVKDKRSKKIVRAQKTDLSHGSGCIATCHSSPITTLFRGQSDGKGCPFKSRGSCGGQVFSVLPIYSDNTSSSSVEVYNFYCVKTKLAKKRPNFKQHPIYNTILFTDLKVDSID